MSSTHRRIRIGIDTGGTFTDVVAFDEDAGTITTTKTPSTPSNPADGFINGVDKVLELLGATGADVTAVSHGTTVATNAILQRSEARLGLITTEGGGPTTGRPRRRLTLVPACSSRYWLKKEAKHQLMPHSSWGKCNSRGRGPNGSMPSDQTRAACCLDRYGHGGGGIVSPGLSWTTLMICLS